MKQKVREFNGLIWPLLVGVLALWVLVAVLTGCRSGFGFCPVDHQAEYWRQRQKQDAAGWDEIRRRVGEAYAVTRAPDRTNENDAE